MPGMESARAAPCGATMAIRPAPASAAMLAQEILVMCIPPLAMPAGGIASRLSSRRGVRCIGGRLERGETARFGREALQQRRRAEDFVLEIVRPGVESVTYLAEPDGVGPIHRPAAPHGPAIAVHPDHVDVG